MNITAEKVMGAKESWKINSDVLEDIHNSKE